MHLYPPPLEASFGLPHSSSCFSMALTGFEVESVADMASKRQLSISELWKKPRLEDKGIGENVVEPGRRGQGGCDNSESNTETANNGATVNPTVSQASQPKQPPVLTNPVLANVSSAEEDGHEPAFHPGGA